MRLFNKALLMGSIFLISGLTYAAGADKIVTVEKSVPAFSKLSIQGDFVVLVKKSNKPHLFITTESSAIPNVITQVNHGELDISYKKAGFSLLTPKVHLTLYLPGYSGLNLMGDVQAVCDDLNTPNLSVNVNGSSTLRLSGKVDELDVNMMGNTKFDSNNLQAEVIRFVVKGSTYSKLNINGASFFVSAAGNNTILYKGRPVRMTNNSMGNNQIRQQ